MAPSLLPVTNMASSNSSSSSSSPTLSSADTPSSNTATTTTTTAHDEIPVLIVGAGPVGLFEAFLLTKMGIRVRIIERDDRISEQSRSLGTQPRSLEILAMVGDKFIDTYENQGSKLQNASLYYGSKRLSSLPIQFNDESRFPTGLLMAQEKTSKILEKELNAMGVKVEYGWELVDTEVVESSSSSSLPMSSGENETHVKTVIRKTVAVSKEGGEPAEKQQKEHHRVIRSEYIIGCDGGRSTVRHKTKIAFPGRTLATKTYMFDGHIDSDLDTNDVLSITGYNYRSMLIFPMKGEKNYLRVVVELPDDFLPDDDIEKINRELTLEKVEIACRACLHPGTKFNITECIWLTCFRINERRAEQYEYKNRIFLAGDSAHVHSPAGGQGMNTGLQDAHNLAWKLALVMNKLAPTSLLQTYQEERRPMADRAIALSAGILRRVRYDGALKHYIKLAILYCMPFLMSLRPYAFPRETAMLEIKYPANSINQPHERQDQPKEQHQVGTRAPDGPLLHLNNTTIDDREEPVVSVHRLTVGVGKFHILVFTADRLLFHLSENPETKTTTTSLKKQEQELLLKRMTAHVEQWRKRWFWKMQENKNTLAHEGDSKDDQLFKVHVIGTVTTGTGIGRTGKNKGGDSDGGVLAHVAQGDGQLFWDSTGLVHERYGIEPIVTNKTAREGGAIVVIRPDSHIGFRVLGIDKAAWQDVEDYFQSILA